MHDCLGQNPRKVRWIEKVEIADYCKIIHTNKLHNRTILGKYLSRKQTFWQKWTRFSYVASQLIIWRSVCHFYCLCMCVSVCVVICSVCLSVTFLLCCVWHYLFSVCVCMSVAFLPVRICQNKLAHTLLHSPDSLWHSHIHSNVLEHSHMHSHTPYHSYMHSHAHTSV